MVKCLVICLGIWKGKNCKVRDKDICVDYVDEYMGVGIKCKCFSIVV